MRTFIRTDYAVWVTQFQRDAFTQDTDSPLLGCRYQIISILCPKAHIP